MLKSYKSVSACLRCEHLSYEPFVELRDNRELSWKERVDIATEQFPADEVCKSEEREDLARENRIRNGEDADNHYDGNTEEFEHACINFVSIFKSKQKGSTMTAWENALNSFIFCDTVDADWLNILAKGRFEEYEHTSISSNSFGIVSKTIHPEAIKFRFQNTTDEHKRIFSESRRTFINHVRGLYDTLEDGHKQSVITTLAMTCDKFSFGEDLIYNLTKTSRACAIAKKVVESLKPKVQTLPQWNQKESVAQINSESGKAKSLPLSDEMKPIWNVYEHASKGFKVSQKPVPTYKCIAKGLTFQAAQEQADVPFNV